MPIITLTTDLGNKDNYVGAIKGAILSELDSVNIIDISHEVEPFNIQQAAYIVRNCYKEFPAGTIHVIGVDDELSLDNEHIALKMDGHFFIAADNGIFSILIKEIKPEIIVELNITQKTNSLTFATKDVLIIAACHLARGGTLEIIGKKIEELKQKRAELRPVIEPNLIKGTVIYIDSYGNAVTNISKSIFNKVQKGRTFSILFGREDEKINKIVTKYKDVSISDKLAIFDNNNQLQIAINQGKANTLLGLKFHDIIRIEFR